MLFGAFVCCFFLSVSLVGKIIVYIFAPANLPRDLAKRVIEEIISFGDLEMRKTECIFAKPFAFCGVHETIELFIDILIQGKKYSSTSSTRVILTE